MRGRIRLTDAESHIISEPLNLRLAMTNFSIAGSYPLGPRDEMNLNLN